MVAREKKKTCIIGDSHLARITKKSFRTGAKRNFVIFKCFRGANTKLLDYYVVPTLVDEKPISNIPVNIYLFRVKNRNTKKDVKYVQS